MSVPGFVRLITASGDILYRFAAQPPLDGSGPVETDRGLHQDRVGARPDGDGAHPAPEGSP